MTEPTSPKMFSSLDALLDSDIWRTACDQLTNWHRKNFNDIDNLDIAVSKIAMFLCDKINVDGITKDDMIYIVKDNINNQINIALASEKQQKNITENTNNSLSDGVLSDSDQTGTIKFFHAKGHYGFINSTNGKEVYFHENNFQGNIDFCVSGVEVKYELHSNAQGRLQAKNIVPVGGHLIPRAQIKNLQDVSTDTSKQGIKLKVVDDDNTFNLSTEIRELEAIMLNRKGPPSKKLIMWSRLIIDDIAVYKKDSTTGLNTDEIDHIIHSHIPRLASIALYETWHFPHDEDIHSILKYYITNTFSRLFYEGKIAFSEEYATFNTGLVDKLYEPIYALFRRRSQSDRNKKDTRPYDFIDWCVAGKNAHGRTLMKTFPVRPSAAAYFSKIGDVIFDDSLSITIQWDHVLQDGIKNGRFPKNFLQSNPPRGFSWADDLPINILLTSYVKALSEDPQTFRSLKNRMDDAIQLARKRASWNYKTAIPSYYPKYDTMNILLPLALIDDSVVDLALVVRRMNEREYYGSTVFPLDLAYERARLVCRPDSDWLRPDAATRTSSDDEEVDDT